MMMMVRRSEWRLMDLPWAREAVVVAAVSSWGPVVILWYDAQVIQLRREALCLLTRGEFGGTLSLTLFAYMMLVAGVSWTRGFRYEDIGEFWPSLITVPIRIEFYDWVLGGENVDEDQCVAKRCCKIHALGPYWELSGIRQELNAIIWRRIEGPRTEKLETGVLTIPQGRNEKHHKGQKVPDQLTLLCKPPRFRNGL